MKRYGTIHLKAGVYPLSAPIDLVNSVSLIADPGAIFSFSQASGDPAWSYAIEVHKSHTTLDGLTIRFATPIRWAVDFQLNPAVIGSAYGESGTSVPIRKSTSTFETWTSNTCLSLGAR